jgi:hypothetical protein
VTARDGTAHPVCSFRHAHIVCSALVALPAVYLCAGPCLELGSSICYRQNPKRRHLQLARDSTVPCASTLFDYPKPSPPFQRPPVNCAASAEASPPLQHRDPATLTAVLKLISVDLRHRDHHSAARILSGMAVA